MDVFRIRRLRRAILCAGALLIIAAGVGFDARPAQASQLVARNATRVSLAVNRAGVAMVSYTHASKRWHVLYWGAKNATLQFHVDRTGGWHSHKANWRTFKNVCGPYRGPKILYQVRACTMADGSSWALQAWQRIVPDYGGVSGPVELRVSHFSGALAQLWIATDWEHNGLYEHLYGTLTYHGQPWYGTRHTPRGYVLDKRGRNVAIDSWNPDYGPGWRRVNMFLTNPPYGEFCFGFMPKGGSPYSGRSSSETYFASVAGPGVSPDVFLWFRGRTGNYDKQVDAIANYWQARLADGRSDTSCSTQN